MIIIIRIWLLTWVGCFSNKCNKPIVVFKKKIYQETIIINHLIIYYAWILFFKVLMCQFLFILKPKCQRFHQIKVKQLNNCIWWVQRWRRLDGLVKIGCCIDPIACVLSFWYVGVSYSRHFSYFPKIKTVLC